MKTLDIGNPPASRLTKSITLRAVLVFSVLLLFGAAAPIDAPTARTSLTNSHDSLPNHRVTTTVDGSPVLTGRNTPYAVGLNWSIPKTEVGNASFRWINISRSKAYSDWGEEHEAALFRIPLLRSRQGSVSEPASAPLTPDEFGMMTFDFVDNNVKHALTYTYRASLTDSTGNRGPWSPAVQITPMKQRFNGLVLICTAGSRRSLVDADSCYSFYSAWAELMGFRILVANSTFPLIRTLGFYRCLIVVMEDAFAQFPVGDLARSHLETYLANGGSVVFVARNHRPVDANQSPDPLIERFLGVSHARAEVPTQNYYAYLPDEFIFAGFVRARAQKSGYPDVEGDSAEAWDFQYLQESGQVVDSVYAAGFVPAIGAVDSLKPGTDVLYTYVSAYDSSFFHGKPIAVRRITDSTAAILFNFPLSLMKHEQAWQALTQAVADLGIDTVNYWLPPTTTTRSMIEWLYRKPASAPDPAWDINRDGVIDIRDVVEELDR